MRLFGALFGLVLMLLILAVIIVVMFCLGAAVMDEKWNEATFWMVAYIGLIQGVRLFFLIIDRLEDVSE